MQSFLLVKDITIKMNRGGCIEEIGDEVKYRPEEKNVGIKQIRTKKQAVIVRMWPR